MNGEAENAPTRPSALLSSSIPTGSPQMPPAGRVVGARRSVADRETFVARRRREETLARARQREEEKKNNASSPQGERGPRKRPGPSRGRRAASVSPPRGRDRPLREATELLSQPLRSHQSSRGRRARSASPGSSARSRGRKYASIPSSGYGQQRDRASHATPGAGSPSGPEPSRMWHAIAQGSPADQPQQGSPAVVYQRRRHMGNGGASKGTPTPAPTPTPTRVVRETRGGKGRSAEVELLQTQEELLATKKRLYGTLEELQQHKRALAVKSEELMHVVGKVQDLMQTFSQLLHLALSRSRARGEDVTTHDAISRLAQTVLHQALADVPSMQHLRQTWEEQIASQQQEQEQQQQPPPSSPPAPSLRSLFAESQQQQEQQRLRPSGASEVAAASAGDNATWNGAFASHPSSSAPRPMNETPLPPWSKQPAERGVAGIPASASPDGLAARLGALQQQLDAQERVPGFDTTAATGHYVSRPGATNSAASSGVRTNGSFDWRRPGAERESATRPFTPQRPGDGNAARTASEKEKEGDGDPLYRAREAAAAIVTEFTRTHGEAFLQGGAQQQQQQPYKQQHYPPSSSVAASGLSDVSSFRQAVMEGSSIPLREPPSSTTATPPPPASAPPPLPTDTSPTRPMVPLGMEYSPAGNLVGGGSEPRSSTMEGLRPRPAYAGPH